MYSNKYNDTSSKYLVLKFNNIPHFKFIEYELEQKKKKI